ncbi:UNVERIFIED_CONTAM: hypothetical protein GTU68_023201 [Idotea baltica]|nr:hypothetical protein [Idotea baltica]
MPTEQF